MCIWFVSISCNILIQNSLVGEEGVGEGGAGGQLNPLYIQGNKTELANLLNAHIF